MGQAKTWPPPRQRGPVVRAGVRLFPPMRAWLEHKGEIAGIPCGTAKNKPKKNFALTREKTKKNTKKHENTPKKQTKTTKNNQKTPPKFFRADARK